MTEPALQFCIQQLLNYDHSEFIRTLELNESREKNLELLMKVTNYFRQVIPVHLSTSHCIRARYTLVADKYKYYVEDVQMLENDIDELSNNCTSLSKKLTNAIEKQHDLTNRVQNLTSCINYKTKSIAENQCKQVLKNVKAKIDSFRINIDNINSKLNAITNYSDQINKKKWYFQDWQLDLVKHNLIQMNDNIKNVISDVNTSSELLNI